MFETFSPEPLGTASLAQVHRATTKDGEVLAVKIQHPKVKAHSYVDIRTMEVREKDKIDGKTFCYQSMN